MGDFSRNAPIKLECDRVDVRAFRQGDGRALCELVQSNRERLTESFPGSVTQLTDENAGEHWIQAKAIEWASRSGFWYGLWERDSSRLIGQIQIKNVDWVILRAEVAYLLDQGFEGKGFMREVLPKILDTCFQGLGLQKVFLRTIVSNERSARLATRFGFKLEGTLRREFKTGQGELADIRYFGLLKEEVILRPDLAL